jgi:hypothetical protein
MKTLLLFSLLLSFNLCLSNAEAAIENKEPNPGSGFICMTSISYRNNNHIFPGMAVTEATGLIICAVISQNNRPIILF